MNAVPPTPQDAIESEAIAMRGRPGRAVAWMTLIVGLLLAGAAHTPAAAQSGGAPVELRVAWWGSQDRHNRTIKAIELFQKKYPNIKVSYEFAGWGDYWTKMTTQAAGRNLPDVMQQDYAYITEWASRGLLAPLDDYVKSGAIDMRDVAGRGPQGRRRGRQAARASTSGTNSQCWVLDVDAFKKAGVELPPPNWTWADFEKTAMALQSKLGIWGMGSQTWDNQIWGALYLSAGQWRYTTDGSRLGYESDKPLVDYFNMLLRLQKANALVPRADELASYNQDTSVELDSPSSAGRRRWRTSGATRSSRSGRRPAATSATSCWPAAAGPGREVGELPEAVAVLQRHHAGQAAQGSRDVHRLRHELDRGERGAPGRARRADLEQGPAGAQAEAGRSQAEMFAYLDRVSKDVQPIPPPDPPGHTEIVKNVFDPQVMDPVAYGRLDPEKAAALLRQEANAILAKAKR